MQHEDKSRNEARILLLKVAWNALASSSLLFLPGIPYHWVALSSSETWSFGEIKYITGGNFDSSTPTITYPLHQSSTNVYVAKVSGLDKIRLSRV
ncbi:hypothetical protein Tco_1049331 [Tanacetum coccineum]